MSPNGWNPSELTKFRHLKPTRSNPKLQMQLMMVLMLSRILIFFRWSSFKNISKKHMLSIGKADEK